MQMNRLKEHQRLAKLHVKQDEIHVAEKKQKSLNPSHQKKNCYLLTNHIICFIDTQDDNFVYWMMIIGETISCHQNNK